jgi:serine/threonine protein kinase
VRGVPLDVGVTFSGHLLSEELGRGGMSRVFRADPVRGGAAVAVKVALDPALVGALRAEGATLRRLSSPRFVKILEEHLDADPPYFVLELCPGGDLGALAAAAPDRRLPVARVLELAREVLDGVGFAHDEGVVHGDLKPENVLLDAEGHAKIADLGLSRAARSSLAGRPLEGSLDTAPDRVRGTFDYLAPEVRKGGPITPSSDVYALGVTLFELLVGERPHGLFRPPSEVLGPGAGVPRALDRVIGRALQPDPLERYQDAAVMLVDLELGDEGLAAPRPTSGQATAGPNPLLLRIGEETFADHLVLVATPAVIYGMMPVGIALAAGTPEVAAAIALGGAALTLLAALPAWLRYRVARALTLRRVKGALLEERA